MRATSARDGACAGKYPSAAITIVADNDDKPGREINPGVTAATKAATAIDARLAIPPVPGDANDLAILQGAGAVAAMVAAAAFVPPPAPTYPEPVLTPEAARAELAQALQAFMAEVPAYWRAVEEAAAATEERRPLRSAGLQLARRPSCRRCSACRWTSGSASPA